MSQGWLYDGQSAVKHVVDVEALAEGLAVRRGVEAESCRTDQLIHIESRPDCEVYGRLDSPGWRLGLPRPIDPSLAAMLPGRTNYGGPIDRVGLPKALAIGAALSAIVLLVGYTAPNWLAPYVPLSVEKKFGSALVGDFGGKFCDKADGQEALRALTAKLTGRAGELNVRVVDVGMVNAAALPGGNIVIFRGLLTSAKGPDEVAGVLGHEIAHVEERHVTEGMIRHLGFGMIVALFGGNTGSNVNAVMGAGYGRAAETEADEGALKALQRASISPLPTADFFARLGEGERKLGQIGAGLEYLSSHPLSARREQRFRAQTVRGAPYRPSLSQSEWQALRGICRSEPERD